jgi:hypothetical protein
LGNSRELGNSLEFPGVLLTYFHTSPPMTPGNSLESRNSIEFHRIPWNCSYVVKDSICSGHSMEFHRTSCNSRKSPLCSRTLHTPTVLGILRADFWRESTETTVLELRT